MTALAYYNEIDPFAVHLLKMLMVEGVIAYGEVDDRPIQDVQPDDLKNYTQCHFFAGGGLWSVAARIAGWPDDKPLWTGSCPCQPFSVAGKGAGTSDPRHLWPDFHRLIAACRPPVVVGEQVAGKAGYGWLDGVRSDLEREGYASRGVDIPACAIDAPHIRQRLYWVGMAHPESIGRRGRQDDENEWRWKQSPADPRAGSGDVADADGVQSRRGQFGFQSEGRCDRGTAGDAQRAEIDMAHSNVAGSQGRKFYAECADEQLAWARSVEWRRGADGKARRVKPGVRLLVDGLPGRVDLLRVGGNAIVPPLAAQVLAALMETEL